MWKDQSVGIPNDALMKLSPTSSGGAGEDGRNFLAGFQVWNEDFTRLLDMDEWPMIKLLRQEKCSAGSRFGLKDPRTGAPIIFDSNCECVRDEETGEFLGGIIVLKDVTEYLDKIAAQKQQTSEQFESVANMIPQMVWTTTPKGDVEWWSKRWYEYTGLTPEVSLGQLWVRYFHPEDMPAAADRFAHSLSTGEDYVTEYRCKRRDGVWRWFLGRARALRNSDGDIVRFFGTCTDIHDAVETREAAKRTKEHLLRVIETSQVTLWTVDRDRNITLLEGSLMWETEDQSIKKEDVIGRNIYEIFEGLKPAEETEFYRKPIEDILSGRSAHATTEQQIAMTGRWFRTRYSPLLRATRYGGVEGDSYMDGVIGISMDVTELRKREEELRIQEKENVKLSSKALAAKEASRMKSQFLANMSHEVPAFPISSFNSR